MTPNAHLFALIQESQRQGAEISYSIDLEAFKAEGRSIITSVVIRSGVPGTMPVALSPETATQRLRSFLGGVAEERR